MLFEKQNYKIPTEDEFNDILDYDKDNVYLYHFIIVKYKENNEIKELNIDQLKDLDKLNNKEIIFKYYIKKIHYYSEPGYFYDEELGDTYYIYNIGYFHIGGLFETKKDDLDIIKKLYEDYHNNYSNINFDFTDEEFLSNNKSINLM